MLKVTLTSGESFEVVFDSESMLTVTHPVYGTQSWTELKSVYTIGGGSETPVVGPSFGEAVAHGLIEEKKDGTWGWTEPPKPAKPKVVAKKRTAVKKTATKTTTKKAPAKKGKA